MANKAIDKSYLLQTLKDFNTKILLMFFQKKLTVTTVPSDPGNGDVIIYVGSTSGNFVQGHTYKYNTSQTSWVDITATGSYSTGDALALNIDGVDTLPFYDSSALSTKRITWLNIISIIKSAFGTAAEKNVPTSGDASSTEVVLGNDTRLTDSRTPISHTHTKSEITDFPTITDTKNTAGSTDTSDKIYLVGAKSQGANPQTYSDNEVFAQNGVLSSKKLSPKCITALTGTGTEGQDKGSGSTNRYVPALWTFNSGVTVANGEVYFIKIPVAGGTYGVYLSLNNGTNYYPVAISNAKARFQTQSPINSVIAVSYESTGICSCYARGGADALTDVTGCFRVVDSYDSNTTYSAMSSSELTTGTATTSRTVRADYLKTGINSLIDTKINGLSIPDELADLSDTTITNPTDGQVLAYDDASDKWINSSQQAVNNATLTIKRNGADVATFSSNASVDVTADIAVPAIINNLMAQYPGKALDATQGKTLKDRTDLNPHWFFRYGSFSKDVPIRFPETGSHGIFSDSYGCQIFPMCDSDANGRPRKFKSVVVYPQEYCELTPAEDILSSYIGLLVFSRPVNSQWATADDAVN